MHYLEKIFPLLIINLIIFVILYFEIFIDQTKNIIIAGFLVNLIGLVNFSLYYTYYHGSYDTCVDSRGPLGGSTFFYQPVKVRQMQWSLDCFIERVKFTRLQLRIWSPVPLHLSKSSE
jgi:hypothetical protein